MEKRSHHSSENLYDLGEKFRNAKTEKTEKRSGIKLDKETAYLNEIVNETSENHFDMLGPKSIVVKTSQLFVTKTANHFGITSVAEILLGHDL